MTIQGISGASIGIIGGTGKVNGQSGEFGEMLRDALQQIDQAQNEAQGKIGEVLQGGGGDLHSAMIAVEKADLSFQLMLQVRNKIVAAYQEISRMNF